MGVGIYISSILLTFTPRDFKKCMFHALTFFLAAILFFSTLNFIIIVRTLVKLCEILIVSAVGEGKSIKNLFTTVLP